VRLVSGIVNQVAPVRFRNEWQLIHAVPIRR